MMTAERLFGWRHGFDHVVTLWLTGGVAALLVLAAAAIFLLRGRG